IGPANHRHALRLFAGKRDAVDARYALVRRRRNDTRVDVVRPRAHVRHDRVIELLRREVSGRIREVIREPWHERATADILVLLLSVARPDDVRTVEVDARGEEIGIDVAVEFADAQPVAAEWIALPGDGRDVPPLTVVAIQIDA